MDVALGSTPDISALFRYQFYEPIYYKITEASFPSKSTKCTGRFVGIAEHVGDALTFKILTDDTSRIIYRSAIRSALAEDNKRISPVVGGQGDHPQPLFVKDRFPDSPTDSNRKSPLPGFEPDSLLGRTFLLPTQDNGERHRAKIIETITPTGDDPKLDQVKFLISIPDAQAEEIVAYNEIVDYISAQIEEEQQEGPDRLWKFREIVSHQGPLSLDDPNYKG